MAIHHELFHAIADPGSAAARAFVVEHALEGKVRFRNVCYEEVQADLRQRSSTGEVVTPALWDGHALVEGEAAVLEGLRRLVGSPG